MFFISASQKPFSIASEGVKVRTIVESISPGITIRGSTIACAICGSRPFASAVERIMLRIYDWYLSGIACPVWFTTVAAPIFDPGTI